MNHEQRFPQRNTYNNPTNISSLQRSNMIQHRPRTNEFESDRHSGQVKKRMRWTSPEDFDHRFNSYEQFNTKSFPETAVLLFNIQNAKYPITVDVMHKICSAIGNVLRIVIMRKRGVQALVEFDTPETAALAKTELD
ncbi:unnamed protein product, partial [Didymodactylos carnosus]